MLTSEWGTPNMVEDGLNPELLLGGKYGRHLHVWDLRKRRHKQVLDLGEEYQLPLELRPAHDPTKTYGFVGVVISLKDLSSSIWMWRAHNGAWAIQKIIEIPAEPANPDLLPPMLKDFKAVPPLLTDIDLSLDDKFLYAACWGTGELRQYDVSDPFNAKLAGMIRLGGIVRRTAHPKFSQQALNGAPQMVEISRDGRRVYFTNSLYRTWDDQFYPDGINGWMAKADVSPAGQLELDPNFFVDFGDLRAHQVRLEGGDASSDSYCFA
jgi:selenium-binding protein 1